MPSYTKVSSGNITPSRFVVLDTAVEGQVLQATTSQAIYGIAQAGTRRIPYGALDDGYAAISGDNLRIYGPPDKDVPLELGGTVTRGDRLASDTSGRGVTTTTTGVWVGAIAMDSGAIGDIIPVQTVPSTQY